MKNRLFLFLTFLLSLNAFSQIVFEKGYYIDNTDQRHELLIKNVDWKNNPTSFEYKTSEKGEVQIANLDMVKEFGIYNESKYLRAAVNIDRSSEKITHLSENKYPDFKQEDLFLKALVEGRASLYEYGSGNFKRYFYSTQDSPIEQLIYKSYLTANNSIAENNTFRQQLWNNLKCPDFQKREIENINYKKRDLVKIFTEYSECLESELSYVEVKEERDLFNLTLRPRFNTTSLIIQTSTTNFRNVEYNNEMSFGFGVEAEFVLPFHKNKWSIILEPTYQNFKATDTIDITTVNGRKLITKVDYKSIELPVGVRHHFFLNDKSKLMVNASLVFDFSMDSSIEFSRIDTSILETLEISPGTNFALGVGYKYNNIYSIEARYLTSREIMQDFSHYGSGYETFSIILGYTLF